VVPEVEIFQHVNYVETSFSVLFSQMVQNFDFYKRLVMEPFLVSKNNTINNEFSQLSNKRFCFYFFSFFEVILKAINGKRTTYVILKSSKYTFLTKRIKAITFSLIG